MVYSGGGSSLSLNDRARSIKTFAKPLLGGRHENAKGHFDLMSLNNALRPIE